MTYLTDDGGATVLLDCAAHPATGETCDLALRRLDPPKVNGAVIVPPLAGRHLAFDGRRVHAVVPVLGGTRATAASPRLTLLVNVWIGHRPLAVEPFPTCLLEKLASPLDVQLFESPGRFLEDDLGSPPLPYACTGGPRTQLASDLPVTAPGPFVTLIVPSALLLQDGNVPNHDRTPRACYSSSDDDPIALILQRPSPDDEAIAGGRAPNV